MDSSVRCSIVGRNELVVAADVGSFNGGSERLKRRVDEAGNVWNVIEQSVVHICEDVRKAVGIAVEVVHSKAYESPQRRY